MTIHPTPLKFLSPNWFVIVMGLCGLALAWLAAQPLLGSTAGAVALVFGTGCCLTCALLTALSFLRWQRYPHETTEDWEHPVRHVFVAAMPISLILTATFITAVGGPGWPARALWLTGSVWQFGITVWALSRWLRANTTANAPDPTGFWLSLTPAMLMPVVGNVLAPLAGGALGFPDWAAAQFGVGVLMWPVILTLVVVRIGVRGLWPDRLLPATFITIAPPAVIGLALLAMGAPQLVVWSLWGLALFFVLWSATIVKRATAQPFALTFWAFSFPLAAFATLTLRLAENASGTFQSLALVVLALTTLVILALSLATLRGLRQGTLLVPEAGAPAAPHP